MKPRRLASCTGRIIFSILFVLITLYFAGAIYIDGVYWKYSFSSALVSDGP